MRTGTKKYVHLRINEKDQIVICKETETHLGVEIPESFHEHEAQDAITQMVRLSVHDYRHGQQSNCHKDLKKDLMAINPHDYAQLLKHCSQLALSMPSPIREPKNKILNRKIVATSRDDKRKRTWR